MCSKMMAIQQQAVGTNCSTKCKKFSGYNGTTYRHYLVVEMVAAVVEE